ncbi:MAG: glycoside hydrolase family 172 protein [Acidimicrobiia bacterium]
MTDPHTRGSANIDSMIDPSIVDTRLDSRAITFESPTGGRGAGGAAGRGRKGAPSRRLEPGERVVLADLDGPGTIRHIWMTFPPAPPEVMRALVLEVFYDGAELPSVSVPCLDFFGLPHGRPVPYASALTSAQEGRGFNAYIPMPFREHVRVEVVNGTTRPAEFYYQLDVTLDAVPLDAGMLHASFRRENPTTMARDFVITDGFRGPGRFIGCAVGLRVLDDGFWYGEGEVKVYRDGDRELPTICGTGLEDYVGTAWGMGVHHAPYAGAPLEVPQSPRVALPHLVGFYRWHVPDPIIFTDELRVTIQQIGMAIFFTGQEAQFEAFRATHPAAAGGWNENPRPGVVGAGLHERVDDYCATAFVACLEPQPVERVDLAVALADIERLPHEDVLPMEPFFS